MRLGRFILAYHVLAPDMLSLILTTILGGGRHDSHFTDEEIGHRVLSYLFHVSQKVGGSEVCATWKFVGQQLRGALRGVVHVERLTRTTGLCPGS